MTGRAVPAGLALAPAGVGRTQGMTVFSRTLIHVTLLAITVIQSFPLVWMLLTSVKNRREVFGTVLPRSIDLSNLARAWTTIDLPRRFLNSLHVTALTVVIVAVVSTLAGRVFARFRGRDAIFYVFIAAMMIPGQAILIPMFQFLKAIGLLDALTGLALSCLGGSVAFRSSSCAPSSWASPTSSATRPRWMVRASGAPSGTSACRSPGPASPRW